MGRITRVLLWQRKIERLLSWQKEMYGISGRFYGALCKAAALGALWWHAVAFFDEEADDVGS